MSLASHPDRRAIIVVVHAAAGGVGLLLTQMLVDIGATVVGLTSNEEKAAAVRSAGASVVLSNDNNWSEEIHARYGRGADVVYESTGRTLLKNMEALRTGGTVVFFGFAGGEPPSINPRTLMDRSLTITGGDLWNVLTGPEERRTRAADLLSLCRSGAVRPVIAAELPMSQVQRAHEMLEGRGTIGKILLVPDAEMGSS